MERNGNGDVSLHARLQWQRILSDLGYSPFRMTCYHFKAAAYLSYDHLTNLIRELLILWLHCNVAMICSCVLSEASFCLMKGRVSVPMFRPLDHKRIVGKSLNFYYGSYSIGVVSPDDLHLHSMLAASSSFFVSTRE